MLGVRYGLLEDNLGCLVALNLDEETVCGLSHATAVKDANHSGVAIVADENAPAVYFDLNGRRVAEPANGLFIKVQGNKATKVIFK